MTFSDNQREKIRRYLGYPATPEYASQIQQRCTTVSSTLPEAEETAKGLLRNIDKIQRQKENVTPFAAQTFNAGAAGTQQFVPGDRMDSLNREAKSYVQELADILSMSIHRDIFGGAKLQTSARLRRS